MVWVQLKNGDGQVLRDIKLRAPAGAVIEKGGEKIILLEPKEFTVVRNKRLGINRYRIELNDGFSTTNVDIRRTKKKEGWEIIGDWHTPEKIAGMFGTKIDPDANKPRSQRASFWKMKSRKGSINYKQKQRILNGKSSDKR